ncbi:Cation/H(+) antiporter 28 -like protein [Gossypium arboreum]|uniref:Cation/H(+) antiporter 28-like protein n=1 Tax=Gossypium arboreum TaxID=29729 RepID=A0A0B0PPV8_GOSAR|nr:Cation/H(+) antiporter 28 -like protein [Gossypium arboreum]
MLRSPQKCPFSNWTQLGLDRDTPVYDYFRPWSRLLNGHRPCSLPVWQTLDRANFPCWPVFSVFNPFLGPFTLLFSPKYKI